MVPVARRGERFAAHHHVAAQKQVGATAAEAEVIAQVDRQVDDRGELAGRLFGRGFQLLLREAAAPTGSCRCD
jgi:hypothetical protein